MSEGEIILYTSDDGVRVQLRAWDGTVWLSQAEIAELYGTSLQNVQQTIARVLADGEVSEATINSELIVRTEGSRQVRREVKIYNLDMVLAVGYRSASPRAVQFRQWATSILREYLVKGFAMDDTRLKAAEGWDYFDEWLERIRSIRASEKRFYQKIRDLYATAVDYDPKTETSKTFFATVQNKMLWAVTGQTAAEIVSLRSDPRKPTMGLTSWSGRVDAFLSFNERQLLTHTGMVQAKVAQALAEARYDEFDVARRRWAAIEDDASDLEVLRAIERKLEDGA
jgi:hypothetical protein